MDPIAEQVIAMNSCLSPLCPPLVTVPQSRPEARVLIVEDDPIVLEVLAMQLEDAGYRVTTAADGEQAVIQAESLRLGLIITDVQMPRGGGLEAYRRLRASRLVSPLLPIIFLTGLRLEGVRSQLPQDPKVRLLSKPVDFRELRASVRELTGVDRSLIAKKE